MITFAIAAKPEAYSLCPILVLSAPINRGPSVLPEPILHIDVAIALHSIGSPALVPVVCDSIYLT